MGSGLCVEKNLLIVLGGKYGTMEMKKLLPDEPIASYIHSKIVLFCTGK
jgi:hypothetical protein